MQMQKMQQKKNLTAKLRLWNYEAQSQPFTNK